MPKGRNLENPGRRRKAGIFKDKRFNCSPQIAVRFDVATIKKLMRHAEKAEEPVSKIIRDFVVERIGE
jgi:hypothetical protein